MQETVVKIVIRNEGLRKWRIISVYSQYNKRVPNMAGILKYSYPVKSTSMIMALKTTWYINIAYQEYFPETIYTLFNLISVPLNIICLY